MTAHFVWTLEYSVGVEAIDEQHRKFFDIANGILDLVGRGQADAGQVPGHIARLLEYALYHFSTEEKYFSDFHYPEAELHIAAHDYFRRTVIEYASSFLQPGHEDYPKMASQAAQFAGEWLMRHIKGMDQLYVKNFHQHGLK